MKTLYIDVYFLVNFTVDIISVYLAGRIAGVKIKALSLIISGIVGAAVACAVVLLGIKGALFIILLILTAFLISITASPHASRVKRIKLILGFLAAETVIGGIVSAAYSFLDIYLAPKLGAGEIGAENRSFLLLALLVLTAYFLIRIFLSAFLGRSSEKSVNLRGKFYECEFELSGMVDSGNLLRDPFGGAPVIIAKKRALIKACKTVEKAVNSDNYEIKKRIKIIPASSVGGDKLLMGFVCDDLMIDGIEIKGGIIAIDDAGDSFGGYDALVPLSLIGDNV